MTADAASHERAVLGKAAEENFPVAPFFLPRVWRRDLMAVYGFARLVDDIGDGDLPANGPDARLLGLDAPGADGPAGRLGLLDALEDDLRQLFRSGGARHPLLRALQPAVQRCDLTPEPFLHLIEANRQDQRVSRYGTYDDLLDYCRLSANPVGRLVLAVTGTTTPERTRRSDAVCTALQIVEHLQDVAEDHRRGRVYLPAEDMKRFGVTEADLAAPRSSPALCSLVGFEAERAGRLLDEGLGLVAGVSGRLRLLLAGFVGGGRAVLDAMATSGHDVLPEAPRPGRLALLREMTAVLRGKG